MNPVTPPKLRRLTPDAGHPSHPPVPLRLAPPIRGIPDDFFKDKTLRRLIRAVLRSKGVPDEELRDVVQDVYEALIVWSRKKGAETTADLCAGARDIAKKLGTRFWRTKITRGKRNVGVIDNADDFAPIQNPSAIELVDIKKILTEIHRLVESGRLSEKGAAILVALAEESTLIEHANDSDQPYVGVRKASERARRTVVEHLEARGMLDVGLLKLLRRGTAVAVAIAMILLFLYSDRLRRYTNEPVANQHRAVPDTSPVPTIVPINPDAYLARMQENHDKAAALLVDAELAYKNMEWRNCIQRIDEATKLDPNVGDSSTLRAACEREEQIDANSKMPRSRH